MPDQLVYPWKCGRCGRRGQLTMPADIDAWGGAEAVMTAHRLRAPRCRGDMGTVRVLRPRTKKKKAAKG
jgi:hypothetical protein